MAWLWPQACAKSILESLHRKCAEGYSLKSLRTLKMATLSAPAARALVRGRVCLGAAFISLLGSSQDLLGAEKEWT